MKGIILNDDIKLFLKDLETFLSLLVHLFVDLLQLGISLFIIFRNLVSHSIPFVMLSTQGHFHELLDNLIMSLVYLFENFGVIVLVFHVAFEEFHFCGVVNLVDVIAILILQKNISLPT